MLVLQATFPEPADAFLFVTLPSYLADHTKQCTNQATTKSQVKAYSNALIISCKAEGGLGTLGGPEVLQC